MAASTGSCWTEALSRILPSTSGIGVAPLFGGLAKLGDVEKIGFAGVGTGGPCEAHRPPEATGAFVLLARPETPLPQRRLQ